MSLPFVIVFERHWDTIPKLLIKDLLPDLKKAGYGTFCFEAPHDLSPPEIIERHKTCLEFDTKIQKQAETLLRIAHITGELSEMSFHKLASLLQLYVSSKKYLEVAEKIKQLPASCILGEVFSESKKLSICLKGIDIHSEDFDAMTSLGLSTRMKAIEDKETHRITTMFQNLLKIEEESAQGVVFLCGVLHAEKLVTEFKKHGLQDKVLYYFPHSSASYNKRSDDIEMVLSDSSDTLTGHTHLLTREEIPSFSKRIAHEISEKTRYTKELIDLNSHTDFLSRYFRRDVRGFIRPGYHLDAFVPFSESSDKEAMETQLATARVETHIRSLEGRNFLVIPRVNFPETAERVRKLAPF
jgi:hypothetical protein